MSALSLDEVVEIARNRLGLAPSDVPRLKTLVPTSLNALGLKVARREDFVSLRSEININVVNGVITLNDPSIIVQTLPETGLLVINGAVAKAAPNYEALTHKMPNDVYRWALRGNTEIHVKDINTGLLGTVNQAGKLAYSRIPTLSDLPDAYNEELVATIMVQASSKVEKPAAPRFDEGNEPLSVNLNAN